MSLLPSTEMELSHAAYEARQRHELTRTGLKARAQTAHRGGKFKFHAGQWQPMPYVGHAVVSMVEGHPANRELTAHLVHLQQLLLFGFGDASSLYCLPSASFHQTLANTLSGERYQSLVKEKGIEAEYPRMVANSFEDFPAGEQHEPVVMELIGLSIFSTAIGILGVFPQNEDFHRLIGFRDLFYDHERVATLGIRRTRPFIGHVTLAYIETEMDSDARMSLLQSVDDVNRSLRPGGLRFTMEFAELRAYSHLAEFKPLPELPKYRL